MLRLMRPQTQLLADGHDLSDARALSDLAFVCGLHLPTRAAGSFGESALADEQARQQLNHAGYADLQQQLRVRAPARPAATMPVRGETLGTGELPGPQPAMGGAMLEQVVAPCTAGVSAGTGVHCGQVISAILKTGRAPIDCSRRAGPKSHLGSISFGR